MTRYLALLAFALVSISIFGCGDDDNDFLVSSGQNTFAASTGTGSLLFSFATAQAALVPTQSTELAFEFFESLPNDTDEAEPLLKSDQSFAASVTVGDVPVSARHVRITVYGSQGEPLLILADEVTVQVGQTTSVDLSDASVRFISAVGYQLFPQQSLLRLGQTLQLEVLVDYSNGDQIALTPAQLVRQISFQSSPSGIVEIDSQGRVTPLHTGTVSVTALHRILGSTQTVVSVLDSFVED